MPNVLWRLFRRQPMREAERSGGDQVPAALPAAPDHGDPGVISTAFDPRPVEAANDSKLVEAARDSRPVEPATDPKPAIDPKSAKPPSDDDTVELQIAALLSAWDKTSLRARRAFLTRIDQRIMTTLRIRSVHPSPGGEAAAG
jgi:hypothetical protein